MRWRRRAHQVVLALYAFATLGSAAMVAGPALNDARIQAIDMGRRGLHDEGADLLRERLEGKVAVDLVTARLLFTLVCALHSRV